MDDLKKEILSLQNLVHPNICELLEIYKEPDAFYFVMSFYECDAKNLIEQQGKINEDEVRTYMRSALKAISYCHRIDTMHRDIKPANLMIDGSEVVLADFGFSA